MRRRSVRGDVHGLSRRAGARRLRRRAAASGTGPAAARGGRAGAAADFYARCAAYPGLARLVGANNVIVGPMSPDEVRRAITQPAERVGLRVDADLEDAMIADVDGQPGALPLLSTALLELWQLRRGGRLQLADVPTHRWSPRCRGAARRGRVRQLQPVEQAARAQLLLRLADEDERGAVVRRRIPLSELGADGDRAPPTPSACSTEHRLLTVSAGRRRGRARGVAPGVAAAARLARGGRRGPSSASPARPGGEPLARGRTRSCGPVPRGTTRVRARVAIGAPRPELDAGERRFLDASRSANEQARHRARFAFAGVVGLLVVAVGRGRARAGERRPRPQAGHGGRRAATRCASAERADPGSVAAAGAAGRRPRRHTRHARQPAGRPQPQSGRRRRDAR